MAADTCERYNFPQLVARRPAMPLHETDIQELLKKVYLLGDRPRGDGQILRGRDNAAAPAERLKRLNRP